jgi:hypothetical protein
MVFGNSRREEYKMAEETQATTETKTETKKVWSTSKVVVVAVVCFMLGVAALDMLNMDIIGGTAVKPTPTLGNLTMIAISSGECGVLCDPTGAIATSEQLFPGIKVTKVDASQEDAKTLIDTYQITILPAYIFSEGISTHANFNQAVSYMDKVGNAYLLKPEATGASWIIDPVARAKAAEELAKKKQAATTCLEKTLSADTIIFLHSLNCPHCMTMKPIVEKLTQYKFHMAEVTTNTGMAPVTECLAGLTNGGVPEFICVGTMSSLVGSMPEEALVTFAQQCGGV